MIDKYTLSKGNDKSFAYSQKHARKITSAGKRKNIVKCKDEDKIRKIVDHYNNHYLQNLHLDLRTHKITNDEIPQLEAFWKGYEGQNHFNKKSRWCKNTLDNMYRDALGANAHLGHKKTSQAMLGDINVEVQMVVMLKSIIRSCNCYLLKTIEVSPVVKEKIKRGRNKSRWQTIRI
jgi:hypothetical protein